MTSGAMNLPISANTWAALVAANERAVETGWALPGMFGTGVGPLYKPGGLLWVGKSAGPLGAMVGSTHSQAESVAASTAWMVQRQNRRSAFWQMAEQLDPTRQSLAWTNVSKMDRIGGGEPPRRYEWVTIGDICKRALAEEIAALRPGLIVMATSSIYSADVTDLLTSLSFVPGRIDFENGWTSLYESSGCKLVITKHPQGWPAPDRDRVVQLIKNLQMAW